MDNVLNRRLFNMGGAVAPGLDAFKGKALQAKSMPMNGIMGFAEGGNPEVERTRVADAYSQTLQQGKPAQMFEGIKEGFASFGDFLKDYGMSAGSAMPLPLSEEVLNQMSPEEQQALLGETEQVVSDPVVQEGADKTVKASNEQLDNAKNKYSAVRSMTGEATGDFGKDLDAVTGEFMQFAKSLGLDLTEEEANPEINPDIAMTLVLMGSKLMQGGTGSDAGDAGQALETGAAYMANKAEKRAERTSERKDKLGQIALQEFLEAKLGTGRTQADSSLVDYAKQWQAGLREDGINLPWSAALKEAKRSASADPDALVASESADMLETGRASSMPVAKNYVMMNNNALRLTSDHGQDDPVVALSRTGAPVTYSKALTAIKNQKAASNGKMSDADAMAALGIKARPYKSILKELYPIEQ